MKVRRREQEATHREMRGGRGGATNRPREPARRAGKRGDCKATASAAAKELDLGIVAGPSGHNLPAAEYYGSMAAGSIIGAGSGGHAASTLATTEGGARRVQGPSGGPVAQRGEGRRRRSDGRASERSRAVPAKLCRAQLVRPGEGAVIVLEPVAIASMRPAWLALTINCLTLYDGPSRTVRKLALPLRRLRAAVMADAYTIQASRSPSQATGPGRAANAAAGAAQHLTPCRVVPARSSISWLAFHLPSRSRVCHPRAHRLPPPCHRGLRC